MHETREQMPAQPATDGAFAEPILVVGPSLSSIGGMATVSEQMMSVAAANGLRFTFHALTESPDLGETRVEKLLRHLRYTRTLAERIRASRARIVHLHTCSGASFFRSVVDSIVVRMLGRHVVLHVHGARFDEFFARAGLVIQRVIRGAFESADAVVALSAGWREKLTEIAPSARIVVIENAVAPPAGSHEKVLGRADPRDGVLVTAALDMREVHRAPVGGERPVAMAGSLSRGGSRTFGGRAEDLDDGCEGDAASFGAENQAGACSAQRERVGETPSASGERSRERPLRFVTLARLDEWKGIDELLAAAGMLAKRGAAFEVVLAGPGGSAYSETTIGTRIAALGLEGRVRYAGTVTGVKKSELLTSADVYVQPSHHEGLPVSVLEAMVHGLAVVATAVGATPEFIETGRHGLLVPPRDAAALARAMEILLRDTGLREAMANACRELGQTRFTLDRFQQNLMRLYHSVALGVA